MILGFTGTRDGMSDAQFERIDKVLAAAKAKWPDLTVRHGDCVGSDKEFHDLAMKFDIRIIIHPPTSPKLRAFCQGAAVTLKSKPYLERDRDIVLESDALIATPKSADRIGGTWFTIKTAESMDKERLIIYPDGREECF